MRQPPPLRQRLTVRAPRQDRPGLVRKLKGAQPAFQQLPPRRFLPRRPPEIMHARRKQDHHQGDPAIHIQQLMDLQPKHRPTLYPSRPEGKAEPDATSLPALALSATPAPQPLPSIQYSCSVVCIRASGDQFGVRLSRNSSPASEDQAHANRENRKRGGVSLVRQPRSKRSTFQFCFACFRSRMGKWFAGRRTEEEWEEE